MTKTLLIACTLMMAGSVYAQGVAVAAVDLAIDVKSCEESDTNCATGDAAESEAGADES